MSDQNAILKGFADLLATADAEERKSYFARVNMMAMAQADPEAFEPPIRNLGEYLDTPLDVPPVLIEPALVVRGAITCTIGRAGKGKTQMNLNRQMRWACGQPMFEGLEQKDGTPILAPHEPLRILIIENEGAAGMFHRQVGIMLNAEGYLDDTARKLVRENLLVWGDGGYSGLKLDDAGQLNNVRAGCEKWQPDILFVEPFRGLWKGEENSSTDMAQVADALSGIASDYNCGVILTHHERKSGAGEDGEKMSAGRGSTVLEGVVATMENFEIAKGGDFRELSWSKIRYGGGHAMLPIRMEWQPGDWWYRHVTLDESEAAILNEFADVDPEPLGVRDLMEVTSEKEHTVRRIVNALTEAGKLKRVKSSQGGPGGGGGYRYRLATGGSDGGGMEF